MTHSCRIAAVLPCYQSRDHVLSVIEKIGVEIAEIIVVDDACPMQTGQHVIDHCLDPRVVVLFHETNQGVGAAVITGYRHALAGGAEIVVKIDSDGQMDPAMVPNLITPILRGQADYAKGNRFFNPEDASAMPPVRSLSTRASVVLPAPIGPSTTIYRYLSGSLAVTLVIDRIYRIYRISSRRK